MVTLRSTMNRKNNMTKFNLLYPNASSKHVDAALLRAISDDYDAYVPLLLAHPNLTQQGFESGFSSAIMNEKRHIIQLFLDNEHMNSNIIIDQLLF